MGGPFEEHAAVPRDLEPQQGWGGVETDEVDAPSRCARERDLEYGGPLLAGIEKHPDVEIAVRIGPAPRGGAEEDG